MGYDIADMRFLKNVTIRQGYSGYGDATWGPQELSLVSINPAFRLILGGLKHTVYPLAAVNILLSLRTSNFMQLYLWAPWSYELEN